MSSSRYQMGKGQHISYPFHSPWNLPATMAIFLGNSSKSALFAPGLNVPALGSLGCPTIKLFLPGVPHFGDIIIRIIRSVILYKVTVTII
jgi:hypothetical protein